MKKYLPFLLFAIIPFYYSCISDNSSQPNYADVASSIGAIDNNSGWSGTLFDTLQNDSLTLHGRSKLILLRLKLPISASSYNLMAGNGQYFNYDNTGSNVIKTFKLDPSYPNTVTNIVNNTTNALNKYITGQFNVRFILDTTVKTNVTTGVDTVTLTNGHFTAVYK